MVPIAQLCRAVSSQLMLVSTIGKKLLNSNISFICFHNIMNFGPLAAEIYLPVWAAANFNGFRVLASLLHRRCSAEVNQTLHDVWLSLALVQYIFGGFCSITKFSKVQNLLCVQLSLAFPYIGSVTAWHSSSGRQPNFAALSRGHHLYILQGGHHVGIGPHSSSYCHHRLRPVKFS